jgi:hypothetical protein
MNVLIRIRENEVNLDQVVKVHRFNPQENSWDLVASECLRNDGVSEYLQGSGIVVEANEGDVFRAMQRKLNGDLGFAKYYVVDEDGYAETISYAESISLRKKLVEKVNSQLDPSQIVEWGEYTQIRRYEAEKRMAEHKREFAEYLRRMADKFDKINIPDWFIGDWREFVQEMARWNTIFEADQCEYSYSTGMFHRQDTLERSIRP